MFGIKFSQRSTIILRENKVTKIYKQARFADTWIIKYINKLRKNTCCQIGEMEPIEMSADKKIVMMPRLQQPKWSKVTTSEGLLQLASQLAWLHARNIRHGDIRKENVMRDDDGLLFFVDYEFASLCLENGMSPFQRSGLGCTEYLSREQCEHVPQLCLQNDIWAFGVLIFTVLSHGHFPFCFYGDGHRKNVHAETISEVERAIRNGQKSSAWGALPKNTVSFFNRIFDTAIETRPSAKQVCDMLLNL
jgi:serine/threonine protein kinase